MKLMFLPSVDTISSSQLRGDSRIFGKSHHFHRVNIGRKKVENIFWAFFLSCSLAFAGDPTRPDPKLTPGDVLTNVTVEQITTKGYANVINGGARHVTESTKRKVFIAYFGKVPDRPGEYEVDHLISLELGGSNDAKNLWPETYNSFNRWNARVKDRLEDWMAASVRQTLKAKGHDAATALLKQYQHEIATDWIAAYRKYLGKK